MYVAYPDDFVQSIAMHDESGNLEPHAIRQTFEIVFAFHQQDGTLELYAKMPTQMKVKLESLFGQIILGEDIGPEQYGRPYDLNRLRDRYFCLETDPEDGLTASITSFRVKSLEWGKIGLEPLQNGRVQDIYDMADHCLNGEAVPWEQVDILKASFRFRFDPLQSRRAGTLEFDVTHPDHCTVRSRRPRAQWTSSASISSAGGSPMSDVLAKMLTSAEGVYPPIFSFDDVSPWPAGELERCVAAGLLRPGRPPPKYRLAAAANLRSPRPTMWMGRPCTRPSWICSITRRGVQRPGGGARPAASGA